LHYYVYNRPENKLHRENPVRFTWVPKENTCSYTICVYGETDYRFENISINFFTPPTVMAAGAYTYSIFADGEEIVSRLPFSIAANADETPLPPRKGRYAQIGGHPRIWQNAIDLPGIVQQSGWDAFIEKAVLPWENIPVHQESAFYPNHKRVISLWRKMYVDCQEALYAIKHSAVAWRVTGEERYLETAKRWLMAVAAWAADGATSRTYNDEAAFRVTTALAWGYDWLHDDLSEYERHLVKSALLTRGRELFDYVKNQIQIHIKLLDSHGVRSLSMTLIPAALALYDEEAEAQEWLDYTIEYFFTLFTPWGGEDGGWAEGPAYWQSGVSFFTEAICLIRKATGIDVFKRPFFQHTGDFPLYTYCQDLRFMAFCDMSDLGDYPGLKAGYTMRILSAVSNAENRAQYAWYYEQAKKRNIGTENLFYNYGWWNFEFDELFFCSLFKPIPPKAPENGLLVKHFKDIGWVAIHNNMANEDNHVAFMFKASPYGSVSHSHGDQNAFVLHAFGEPLAIQSGYYIGFWSEMHVNWRRQTKSKNALLIDGIGQFAALRRTTKAEEMNGSAKSQYETLIAANGQIERCEFTEKFAYIIGDAANAFKQTVPYLKSNKRHVLALEENLFIIIDEVELEQEGHLNWLLHGLSAFELGENQFSLRREKANLDVLFLKGDMSLSQTDEFDGVIPSETADFPPQYHLTATTRQAAAFHQIITLLAPYKAGGETPLRILDKAAWLFSHAGKKYQLLQESGRYKIEEKP
jgi:Heparinase II/III-like protein.